MKSFVNKYYVIFVLVATLAGCTKVTQTQSTSGGGDTQTTVKVDTPVKTKPTLPDSTSQLPKTLYLKVVGFLSNQPLSNVTVAISNCILDTTTSGVSQSSCPLAGIWQTDANGTIFIDSSEKLAIPGHTLRFALSKGNYWTDSSFSLYIPPGPNKVDTLTFTLYAVSWLKVHVQDSIPSDSGQLEMYFTPNGIIGPIVFLPAPPPSTSNFQLVSDPQLLIGYWDHLKEFGHGSDLTFIIKTTGSTNNQIFIERYISYYDKPGLYNEIQIPNDFDTLDWEIKLH